MSVHTVVILMTQGVGMPDGSHKTEYRIGVVDNSDQLYTSGAPAGQTHVLDEDFAYENFNESPPFTDGFQAMAYALGVRDTWRRGLGFVEDEIDVKDFSSTQFPARLQRPRREAPDYKLTTR